MFYDIFITKIITHVTVNFAVMFCCFIIKNITAKYKYKSI